MSCKGGTKRRVHRRRRTVRRGGTSLAGSISGFFKGIKNKVFSPAVGGKRRRRRRTAKKSMKREEEGVVLVVGAGGRRRKRSGMTKKSAHKSKRREDVELEGGNCQTC